MEIRPANENDNSALQVLQAKCPQGTTLVVSAVNTPDFFARVRAYKDYQVYVACENDRIIGSAACGIRDATMDGRVVKIGHQFQAFVHPEYRGRRIAGQLTQIREQYLKQKGAVLAYSLIMEGNIPSMLHVERQNYRCHRTLVMPGLSVFKEMHFKSFGMIRPLIFNDLDAAANLLNKTWRDYELCEPMTGDELSQFIDRTPAYDFNNVFVLEEDNEIVACLGFWDWSQVTRLVVEKLNVKLKMAGYAFGIARYLVPMPRAPKIGEVLRQMMLTPIGFQNPRQLAVLLQHINNLAFQRGVGYIYCICEPAHPLLKSLRGFARIDTAIHLYIKPLQEDISLANKPVFINGIDL